MALALLGTSIMSAAGAHPQTTENVAVLLLGDGLLAAGLVLSIYSAASLGDCFAVAPEARGLVTSRAYQVVRHPVYASELVAAVGVTLPLFSPSAVLILALFCLLQGTRAAWEERVLVRAFPEYADYRRTTPAFFPRRRCGDSRIPRLRKHEHHALAPG